MQGRKIFKGRVIGEALVTGEDISFYGGCDPETGYPKESKLRELGLDFVTEDLKSRGMTR